MKKAKLKRLINPRWLALGLSVALSMIVGGLAAPRVAEAHDGSHVSRIVSDVQGISVEGAQMGFHLIISNLSEHTVTLESISARDAEAAPIAPVLIGPGDQQVLDISLSFQEAVPGIFTAVLDFGAAGQGPVLVMH